MKRGVKCKLPLLKQFFMTLVRLRLGLLERDLAHRFNVSQSTVCCLTLTWIHLMYLKMKSHIECYPSWHIVQKYMPRAFKEYPNTRLTVDATEFFVERPSSMAAQSETFSAYKNCNTVKSLIGITPSGQFVSYLQHLKAQFQISNW